MKLTNSGTTTPVYMTDSEGNVGQGNFTGEQLVPFLDQVLANRKGKAGEPGALSKKAEALPPPRKKLPLDKWLQVAATQSYAAQGVDRKTERAAVERGIMADADGMLMTNNDPMVAKNNLRPTGEQNRELAHRTADIYLRNKLIGPDDSVMVVGADMGHLPARLKHLGVKSVDAIEPRIGHGVESHFKDAMPLTGRQFIERHPEKQYTVVEVGKISAASAKDKIDMEATADLLECAFKMTADSGTTLVTISGRDPHYVSGVGDYRLRPLLEALYGKENVQYLSPSKLGEEVSIAGAMGLFKCTKQARAAEVPASSAKADAAPAGGVADEARR